MIRFRGVPTAASARQRSAAVFFIVLAALVLLAGALPPALQAELLYSRGAVASGEVWRLLTASLVHLELRHGLWNLVALAGLGAVLGRWFGGAGWSVVAVVSALGAGGGVFLASPQTVAMAGLSAVLHGLAAAGALAATVRGRGAARVAGFALLLLLTAKLAWEQVVGPLPGVAEAVGGRVAVDAHLYGASAGLLAGAGVLAVESRRGHPNRHPNRRPTA